MFGKSRTVKHVLYVVHLFHRVNECKQKFYRIDQPWGGDKEKHGGGAIGPLAPRWLQAWLNSILQIFQSNLCLN